MFHATDIFTPVISTYELKKHTHLKSVGRQNGNVRQSAAQYLNMYCTHEKDLKS